MSYVLVTSRKWNEYLVEKLEEKTQQKWYLITKREEFTLDYLQKISPVKIFIPHWSYIIPKDIWEEYECVVFHMTDLPFGRGGSPLQNLIVRKIRETKISAIKVSKEIDEGDIYLKSSLGLEGAAHEIFKRFSIEVEKMILKIINENIHPVPQEGEITLFERRKPEQGNLFKLKQLEDVYDYIRMLDAPGYPKAFVENKSFKIEFENANFENSKSLTANVRIIKK